MEIRIEAVDLPGSSCGPSPDRPDGYPNIHVGVQRRGRREELLGLTRGDAASVSWTIDCTTSTTADGIDLKGPYVEGRPGGRFIYLSWVVVEDGSFDLFRRAKLMLDAVPPTTLDEAISGALVGSLGLTDPKGNPLCAAVRPPVITWAAAP